MRPWHLKAAWPHGQNKLRLIVYNRSSEAEINFLNFFPNFPGFNFPGYKLELQYIRYLFINFFWLTPIFKNKINEKQLLSDPISKLEIRFHHHWAGVVSILVKLVVMLSSNFKTIKSILKAGRKKPCGSLLKCYVLDA